MSLISSNLSASITVLLCNHSLEVKKRVPMAVSCSESYIVGLVKRVDEMCGNLLGLLTLYLFYSI